MYRYTKKIEVEYRHCPECLSYRVKVTHNWQSLAIQDGWEEVDFFLPRIHCDDCGEVTDAAEAHEAVHDTACVAQGLLTPQEVRELRGERSRGSFAHLLRCGETRVADWENRVQFPYDLKRSKGYLTKNYLERID